MDTADTPRQLVSLGARPIILDLLSQGAPPKEIAQVLEDDYDIRTSARAIQAVLRAAGMAIDAQDALAVSTQKEIAILRSEAHIAYQEHRADYLKAKARLTYNHKEAFEEMQFYAEQFGKWWDRISKFYPLAVNAAPQAGNSILNVILSETSKGNMTPTTFENIIRRLDPAPAPIDVTPNEATTVPTPPPQSAVQDPVQGLPPSPPGHDDEPEPVGSV